MHIPYMKQLAAITITMSLAIGFSNTASGSDEPEEMQSIHCRLAGQFSVDVLLRAFKGPVEVVYDGPDFTCTDPAQQADATSHTASQQVGYVLKPVVPYRASDEPVAAWPSGRDQPPKPVPHTGPGGGGPTACICLPETMIVLVEQLKIQGTNLEELGFSSDLLPAPSPDLAEEYGIEMHDLPLGLRLGLDKGVYRALETGDQSAPGLNLDTYSSANGSGYYDLGTTFGNSKADYLRQNSGEMDAGRLYRKWLEKKTQTPWFDHGINGFSTGLSN